MEVAEDDAEVLLLEGGQVDGPLEDGLSRRARPEVVLEFAGDVRVEGLGFFGGQRTRGGEAHGRSISAQAAGLSYQNVTSLRQLQSKAQSVIDRSRSTVSESSFPFRVTEESEERSILLKGSIRAKVQPLQGQFICQS